MAKEPRNQGIVVTEDSDLMKEIPKGSFSSLSVINKFGSNPNISDGQIWEVWDGGSAYTWPTTDSITHIRSAVDSATTQSVVVEVQGLDTNYDLVIQNVTTDGTDSTTEVALTTALRRVFRMKVLDNSVMDQDLWVGPTGFASKQAIIQAGNNQTLMAIYTVPAGCTAYITNYYCDYVRTSAKDPDGIDFHIWFRDNSNGYAPQLKHEKGIPKQAPGFQHFFKPYYKATEKTDIYITGNPNGKPADCHAGFDIILETN